MSLLEQAPRLAVSDAVRVAREMYGLETAATILPSERDQNFLLAEAGGEQFVLKIANAAEERTMLEAQNAAMDHVSRRVAFCPRVMPTRSGGLIGLTSDGHHFVRLVTYVAGVPLAETARRTPALLDNIGRAVGRLDEALADFDHPAIHRDFYWDLSNATRIIDTYLPLVHDAGERRTIEAVRALAERRVAPRRSAFARSAVHHDANDWNVLVRGDEVAGLIDFGDMVYSWTVADPAVAAAYAILDAPDPRDTSDLIVRGYLSAHPLRDEERDAVLPLAALRLCTSACIAASQRQQRPDDDYLAVSQAPIRRTLPRLADILEREQ